MIEPDRVLEGARRGEVVIGGSGHEVPRAAGGAPIAADPWAPLLDAGLQLIESLAARPGGAASPWVQTDADGRRFLKLPLPEPQVLQRLADGLAGLLGTLRERQNGRP